MAETKTVPKNGQASSFAIFNMLHGTGIFTYISHKCKPNVCKYSRHGAFRLEKIFKWWHCLDFFNM